MYREMSWVLPNLPYITNVLYVLAYWSNWFYGRKLKIIINIIFITAYSSRSTWVHSMCYSIFSFMCMFCRSLFVLCTFSFGHCVICSSSIYGFWLPLWLSSNSSSHPVFGGVRVAHLFSFPVLWCAQCWQCFLIALSGFYNISLMTLSISENTNIKIVYWKHQF